MQWWCVQLLLPSSKKKCWWWSCLWPLMPLQLLSLFVSKSKHLANARCLQWSRMPGRVRVFVVEQMVHFFPRLHELPRWDMPKREELFGAHSHWPPQLFRWAGLLSVSSSSFKIKEAGISMHLPKLWSAGWAHSEFPSEVYTRTSLCCIAIELCSLAPANILWRILWLLPESSTISFIRIVTQQVALHPWHPQRVSVPVTGSWYAHCVSEFYNSLQYSACKMGPKWHGRRFAIGNFLNIRLGKYGQYQPEYHPQPNQNQWVRWEYIHDIQIG